MTRSEDFLIAGHAQQEIYIMKSAVVRDPEHQYVISFFELSYNEWTLISVISDSPASLKD